MAVNYLEGSSEEEYFYSERFKVLVRSEKEHLLKTSTVMPFTDKAQAWAMKHNIYMFLRNNNVPEHLLWATAYINGIENPFSNFTHLKQIFMINEQTLNNSISRSNTVRG